MQLDISAQCCQIFDVGKLDSNFMGQILSIPAMI